MAILFGNKKVHILLIDSEGVNLLLWNGKSLKQFDFFEPVSDDFDRFQMFCETSAKTPCVIITDFIEEDFRTELVVHVTGSDRAALLNRRLNLLFRKSLYRTASVIGREKTGRKDDKVLFTALTKPEIIDPWINRLLNQQVSITSLTSAAYLMELFAQSLALKAEEHLLIVNQEDATGLRQTYLRKGRVIFSRLTRTGISDTENFSSLLLEQCDQTRKYLERIKQLPYDTPLNVHVFTAAPFSAEAERIHEQLHFLYRSIDELRPKVRVELNSQAPGAIAYSIARALRKKGIPNIYAPFSTRRYLFIRTAGRYLNIASVFCVIGMLMFLSPTLLNITAQLERETQMSAAAQPLLERYEQLRERFPETPIQSGQMELVVSTYDAMLAQIVNQERTLAQLSEALKAAPELTITGVAWELDYPSTGELVYDIYGMPESAEERFQRALVNGQMAQITRVRGVVQSAASYREARRMIDAFAQAMQEQTGAEVNPINLPMDVSVNALVTTVVDGRDAQGEFTLEYRQELIP